MIKKRWNIKKEKLKEKLLNEQRGFIVGNALIILPLIFSLIIAILVIVQAISSSIFNYIDNWILQEQTKNILENMATEITYADEIIDQIDFAHKETLIIATKEGLQLILMIWKNISAFAKKERLFIVVKYPN